MKEKRKGYFLLYTLVFALCCAAVFFTYYSTGKSFIYDGDGWSQHYKAYLYYSEYLRSVFTALWKEHRLILPQYDFSIGEGGDILGTFHYYVIGDPIAFLSVFVRKEHIYIFYHLGVVLRLYLSGIFFSCFCFSHGLKNRNGILAGTLTYVFCFWALFNSVRHIYFLNPMMYLPLILIGADKIIHEGKPLIFVVAVFLSCISNFYFFYNIAILTAIYSILVLLFEYRKDVKRIVTKVMIIFCYAVLGICLGAFIFVPVVYVFLKDSRMSIEFGKHLIYPLNYYKKIPSMFFSTGREYWLCMGYASPAILFLMISFRKLKENLLLNVFNILGILMVLFPVFGQVMNGFSYISNKWCFALSLLVAFNMAFQWEEVSRYRKLLGIFIILCTAILAALGANTSILIPLFFCFLFLGMYFLPLKENIRQTILLLLIILCIAFNADHQYSERGTNYSNTATTYEQDREIFRTSEAYEISENISDEDFYRYSGNCLTQNAAVLFQTHSTDYYWSLGNPFISEYRNEMEIDEYLLQKFNEYGQRALLYSLANVRYYVTQKGDQGQLPYGFVYDRSTEHYDLYRNEYALPFGYTYENAISYEEWKEYSVIDRQDMMAKALVIDRTPDDPYEAVSSTVTVDYVWEENDDVAVQEGKIKTKKQDAETQIRFNEIRNLEVYLEFKGLVYDDNRSWISDKKTNSDIYVVLPDGSEKKIDIYTHDDRYYNGRKDFVIRLGFCDFPIDHFVIRFQNKGSYTYDSISLYTSDMQEYGNDLDALQKDVLKNVHFARDAFSGTIDLRERKYLLLSIPYSEGWSAYVDGKKADIIRANIAYMALDLDEGSHEIVFEYRTPMLKQGALISLCGIAAAAVILIIRKRKTHE
ncbi:MAG: YfhO family protein [Erysipelotrichaceae bacterium]|nr:YfhO family protein [Erysipelotrichaceae bacterium]